MNFPHKGQWREALMFSLICAWINGWVKQWWGWWFETPSHPLWRHGNAKKSCNDIHASSLINWFQQRLLPHAISFYSIIKNSCCLTHWNLVTFIFVGELGTSGNGLSPVRVQSITWTNADLFPHVPLGKIYWYNRNNCHLRKYIRNCRL